MDLFNIFKKKTKNKHTKSMTLIKTKADMDYVLMDAILIILSQKGQLNVSQLQYELLSCGLMVQQPLLKEAIAELAKHNCLTRPILN